MDQDEVYKELDPHGASYFIGIADNTLAVLYNEAKVWVATSKCQGLRANAASNIDN